MATPRAQSMPLAARRAVITGGSSGIGLALALRLLAEGARVAVADRLPPAQPDPALHYFETDVRDGAAIDRLYAQVDRLFGTPDLLVVSAGQGIHERLFEGDPAKWQAVLDTNVMGALRAVRAFVPAMLAEERGDVVVISSVAAGQPHAWGGVYGASKAALAQAAETLRLEVQPHVRVTSIVPGVVDTSFFERRIGGGDTPSELGWGVLTPADVADAVIYAVTRPPHMAVNQLVLRPAGQPF